jgi:hypothetical protein
MSKSRGQPFTPGDKRINRAGRPVKSDTLSDCLRELASQPGSGGLTHAQKLARVLWRKAEAGDVRAAGLIADRLEGKPGQRVEVTTPQPLSFSEAAALMQSDIRRAALGEPHGPVYSGVIPPSQAGKPER